MNHTAFALFAQRTRIPTSARSIGFCVIWVCISSSSSSPVALKARAPYLLFRAQRIFGLFCIVRMFTSNFLCNQ